MTVNKYKFGENIYEVLKQKKLKQIDVAKAMNTTEVQVSRWMNGERMPQVLTLIRIARFLGVSTDRLLRGVVTE